MKIEKFGTDEQAEIYGVWKAIGEDAKIKVAREGNQRYLNAIRDKLAAAQYVSPLDMPEDEWNKLHNEAIAETILLGWEGLEDEEGNVPEYSVELAVEWLTKYKEFKKIVLAISSNVEHYRTAAVNRVKENIKK
jgi:hypothetical protein